MDQKKWSRYTYHWDLQSAAEFKWAKIQKHQIGQCSLSITCSQSACESCVPGRSGFWETGQCHDDVWQRGKHGKAKRSRRLFEQCSDKSYVWRAIEMNRQSIMDSIVFLRKAACSCAYVCQAMMYTKSYLMITARVREFWSRCTVNNCSAKPMTCNMRIIMDMWWRP